MHDGPGRWDTARDGRRVALGAGAAALASGLVVLFRSGPPWPMTAMSAGLLAVLLLAAGRRAVPGRRSMPSPERSSATRRCPYAFAAGVLAPLRTMPLTHVSALAMLAGFALVLTAALIAATAIAHGMAVFFGAAVAAAFGIAAAALACLWPGLARRRCGRAGGHPGPRADAARPGRFVPAGPARVAGRPGQRRMTCATTRSSLVRARTYGAGRWPRTGS